MQVFHDCPDSLDVDVSPGESPPGEFRRDLTMRDGVFQRVSPECSCFKEDEGPQNRVVMDMRLATGRTEVTYNQWLTCVEDAGCGGYVPPKTTPVDGDDIMGDRAPATGLRPVLQVSHPDPLAHVGWLDQQVGAEVYRPPIEADWKHAARARRRHPPRARGRTRHGSGEHPCRDSRSRPDRGPARLADARGSRAC